MLEGKVEGEHTCGKHYMCLDSIKRCTRRSLCGCYIKTQDRDVEDMKPGFNAEMSLDDNDSPMYFK